MLGIKQNRSLVTCLRLGGYETSICSQIISISLIKVEKKHEDT